MNDEPDKQPQPRNDGDGAGGVRKVPADLIRALHDIRADVVGLLVRYAEPVLLDPAEPDAPRRRALLVRAVDVGVGHFIDRAAGSKAVPPHVAEAYRRLGRAEAEHRHDVGSLNAAWQIATTHAWRVIRELSASVSTDTTVVAHLGTLLLDLTDELFRHAESGFHGAKRPYDVRGKLGRALLHATGRPALLGLLAAAEWPAPHQVTVAVVEHRPGQVPPPLASLGRDVLTWTDVAGSNVVFDANAETRLRPALIEACHPAPIALMGPVPFEAIAEAHRWARRALELRREGRLPADRVVDCGEWLDLMLIASDPELLEYLSRAVLSPLAELGPHQRYALAQTLHETLVNGGAAHQIAVRIGVHPNTVRNRLKHLRALFSDRLQDPRERVRLVMALSATLPVWRHADKDSANHR
jgi:hypothetical protein